MDKRVLPSDGACGQRPQAALGPPPLLFTLAAPTDQTGHWELGGGGPSLNARPPRASKLSLGGLKLVARSQPTVYLLGGQPNFQLQTEAHT